MGRIIGAKWNLWQRRRLKKRRLFSPVLQKRHGRNSVLSQKELRLLETQLGPPRTVCLKAQLLVRKCLWPVLTVEGVREQLNSIGIHASAPCLSCFSRSTFSEFKQNAT